MMRFCLAFFIFLSLPVFAQSSMTDGVLINADNMDRDLEKQRVILKGNVQVVFQGQNLSCDRAEIDLKKQQITAQGNVILSNERVHVEGDRIIFNYKKNTGLIYNGFVQSGQVVFVGDVIEKVAEQHYIASNAEYTACETCPPGWSFSGKVIDAEIGGYARIRRPIFRIAGVPVLILPSLIVPLKSARQSGFLVPSLEFSQRGGAAFSESYFWAIDRSHDFTFTPTYYEKLGPKLHGDYRYMVNQTSAGRMRTAWLRDKVFQSEQALTDPVDRYFLWYDHRLDMPQQYTHRMNIVALSDLRYPRDFPEEVYGHGDPALENKISLTKTTDNTLATGEVDIYTNLLKTDPLASNDDAVHRAPELRYSVKEQNIGETGFLVGMDMSYVNFARGSSSYDDLKYGDPILKNRVPLGTGKTGYTGKIERDGKYDPNIDLWRTGQRFDARPTIMYPFHIYNKFDLLPKVSYRETQYRFSPTESAEEASFIDTAARRYVQTDLAIKTEFSRIYGSDDPKANRYKHSIEPEIAYSHIPWMRRPRHPFFGEFEGLQYSRQFEFASDSNLNTEPGNTGIQFDYEDRTYARQVIDLSIANTLTRKTWVNGEPVYKTAAIFALNQAYDLNEARSRSPHPWSLLNGLLDMRFEHFETYTTASYSGYAKVSDISTRVKALLSPRNYLQASYIRNYDLNDNYTVASETRNAGIGAGVLMRYFETVGQFEFEARTWRLQSFSYAVNLRPPGKCWLIKFEHRQVVGSNDPVIRASFNFDFGGENSANLL